MKKQLLIGKIGNDKVILDIEIKDKPITSGAITMALTPVTGSTYKTLSISGSIGNHSYGQIYDSINPSDFDELYMNREQFIHLLAIWKVCHLNDLNAGTLLQTEYINHWTDQMGNRYDYTKACAMLKQHHLLIDHETNPELTVGYSYGSLWLVNPLPDDVIQFISNLQSTPPDQIRSPILDYLLEHNFKWNIRLTDSNPHMQSNQQMDHWKVTFIDAGDSRMETYFSTGIGHRLFPKDRYASNVHLSMMVAKWMNDTIKTLGISPDKNKRVQLKELGFSIPTVSAFNQSNEYCNGIPVPPMPDQVIECIVSDHISIDGYHKWDDWATDLGFDLNSKSDRKNAKRGYENTIDQSEQAQMFFQSHWSELIEMGY